MRGARGATLQHRQILRLPRKVTFMIDLLDTWNIIYNARSNRCRHKPTSPTIAPPTKNSSRGWRHTWKSFSSSGPTGVTVQRRQILRPPRKRTFQNMKTMCWVQMEHHLQRAADSSMARTWSEHEIAKLNPPVRRAYFSSETLCAENYNASRSGYFNQISPNAAPATQRDTPTSPNVAPATTSDAKRCACHEKWGSNVTKYCACHEKNDSHDVSDAWWQMWVMWLVSRD